MLGGLYNLVEVRVQAGPGGRHGEVLRYERGGLEGRLRVVKERGGDLCLHDLARRHLHGDAEVRGGGAGRGARPGDEGAQAGQGDGGGGQADSHWDVGVQVETEIKRL